MRAPHGPERARRAGSASRAVVACLAALGLATTIAHCGGPAFTLGDARDDGGMDAGGTTDATTGGIDAGADDAGRDGGVRRDGGDDASLGDGGNDAGDGGATDGGGDAGRDGGAHDGGDAGPGDAGESDGGDGGHTDAGHGKDAGGGDGGESDGGETKDAGCTPCGMTACCTATQQCCPGLVLMNLDGGVTITNPMCQASGTACLQTVTSVSAGD